MTLAARIRDRWQALKLAGWLLRLRLRAKRCCRCQRLSYRPVVHETGLYKRRLCEACHALVGFPPEQD